MRRLFIALLLALALIGATHWVLQLLLEDQCDLGLTPAECAQLG